MTFKQNSYLIRISRCDPVNLSTFNFPKPILQKQLTIYLLFKNSLKKGCNNLCLLPYTFDMSYKSFSYQTSLSRPGTVNRPTPIIGNINLITGISTFITNSLKLLQNIFGCDVNFPLWTRKLFKFHSSQYQP